MFLDAVVLEQGQDPAFPNAPVPDGEYADILGFQLSLMQAVMTTAGKSDVGDNCEQTRRLPSFSDGDISNLRSVVGCLQSAQHTSQWLDSLRNCMEQAIPAGQDPIGQAGEILKTVVSRCSAGQHALLPLGFRGTKNKSELGRDVQKAGAWGAFALVVEPTTTTGSVDEYCTVTVCASGGGGFLYHPRATDDGAEKVKAAPLVLEGVPLARFLDPAFTTVLQRLYLVPSQHHSSRVLYEVLLPFLIDGKSVAHAAAQVDEALYATSHRVLESRVRTCLCATRYLLFRQGLGADLIKELMLSLRLECLDLARQQLEQPERPQLTMSDIRTLHLMTANVSLCSAKRQQLGVSPLVGTLETVGTVKRLVGAARCPFRQARRELTMKICGQEDGDSTAGPPLPMIFPATFVDATAVAEMAKTEQSEPVVDSTVSRCAGKMPVGDSGEKCSMPPERVCCILADTLELCEVIAARGGLANPLPPAGSRGARILAALQLTSWVDDVFESQLSVPQPAAGDTNGDCLWSLTAWTEELRCTVLRCLHGLAAQYVAASVCINGPLDPDLVYKPQGGGSEAFPSEAGLVSSGHTSHPDAHLRRSGQPPGMESDRRHAARTLTLASIFAVSDCIFFSAYLRRQPQLQTTGLSADNFQEFEFADLSGDLELTCWQALRRKELVCYFESRKPAMAENGLWKFSRICLRTASANRDACHCASVGLPLRSTRTLLVNSLLAESERLGVSVNLRESAASSTFPRGESAAELTALLKKTKGDVQWAVRMHFEKQQTRSGRGPPPPPSPPPSLATQSGTSLRGDVVPWESFRDSIIGEPDEDVKVDTTLDVATCVFRTSTSEAPSTIEEGSKHVCADLLSTPPLSASKMFCYCRDISFMAKACWQVWPDGLGGEDGAAGISSLMQASYSGDYSRSADVVSCAATGVLPKWHAVVIHSKTTNVIENTIIPGGVLTALTGVPIVLPKQFSNFCGVNIRRYVEVRAMSCSEEHLLFCPALATFDDYCSQEETERLLSALTAPLIRIPLALAHFASEREPQLFHPALRAILRAVLLTPFQTSSAAPSKTNGGGANYSDIVPLPADDLRTPWSVLTFEITHSGKHCLSVFDGIIRAMLDVARQSNIHSAASFQGTIEMLSVGAHVEEYCAGVLRESDASNASAEVWKLQVQLGNTLRTQGLALLQTWLEQASQGQDADVQKMMELCVCIAEVLRPATDEAFARQSRLFLSCAAFVVVQMEGAKLSPAAFASVGASRLLAALRAKTCEIEAKYCSDSPSEALAEDLSSIVEFATGGSECQRPAGWHQMKGMPHVFCEDTGRVTFDLRTASVTVLGCAMQPVPTSVRLHLDLQDCLGISSTAMLCSVLPAKTNVTRVQIAQNQRQYLVSMYADTAQLQLMQPDSSAADSSAADSNEEVVDWRSQQVVTFDGLEWAAGSVSEHPLLEQFAQRWADECGELLIWNLRSNTAKKSRHLAKISSQKIGRNEADEGFRELHLYGGHHPRIEVFSVHQMSSTPGVSWVGSVRHPVYTSDARNCFFIIPEPEKPGSVLGRDCVDYKTGGTVISNCLASLQFESGHPLGFVRYDERDKCYRIQAEPWTKPAVCEDCFRTDCSEVPSSHGVGGRWRWCTACSGKHAGAQPMGIPPLMSIVRLPRPGSSASTSCPKAPAVAVGSEGPCLWAPSWQLAGLLPAVLVENFHFWRSCTDIGVVHGEPRSSSARTRWTDYQLLININAASFEAVVHRIDSDGRELVLVDGRESSFLSRKFAQLEDLSHVLFWGENSDASAAPRIILVELPRLGTAFVSASESSDKLHSIDNRTYFVSNADDKLVLDLIGDLPSFLLLEETETGQLRLMVANAKPVLAKVSMSQPLLTLMRLSRGKEWCDKCSSAQRFFHYPIHPLRQHFDVNDLASSLYLFMLQLLTREYEAAAALVTACATDRRMTSMERWIFELVVCSTHDKHPEASACRLLLFDGLINGVEESPKGWDVVSDVVRYCSAISHVRPSLRIGVKSLQSLVDWAIAQGEAEHAIKRTASFQRGDMPTPQSWRKSVLQLHRRRLGRNAEPQQQTEEGDGEGKTASLRLTAECFHGGGGWNRLESQVASFFTADKWTDGEFVPMRLARPRAASEGEYNALELFASEDFWEGADACLLYVYESLRGSLRPAHGSGKAWAQLMALSIYLHRQPLQDTPFWEETSQHLLAAMAFNPCFDDAETRRTFPEVTKPRFKSATTVNVGGGPAPPPWAEQWLAQLAELCTNSSDWTTRTQQTALLGPPSLRRPVFVPRLHPGSDTRCARRVLKSLALDADLWFVPAEELQQLALQPLECSSWLVARGSSAAAATSPAALPFNVSEHPDCQHERATSFLERVATDAHVYDARVDAARNCEMTLRGIDWQAVEDFVTSEEVLTHAQPDASVRPIFGTSYRKISEDIDIAFIGCVEAANSALQGLRQALEAGRKEDRRWLDRATAALVMYANNGVEAKQQQQPLEQVLMQHASQVYVLSMRDLILASASSTGERDIAACCPTCDPSVVIEGVVSIMLICSRLTQTGHALQAAASVGNSLHNLLETTGSMSAADRVGDFQTHVANLSDLLQVQRHHTARQESGGLLALDPRMLAFECTSSVVLRKRQVEIVSEFLDSATAGHSGVRQMLMGAGKSSIISPLVRPTAVLFVWLPPFFAFHHVDPFLIPRPTVCLQLGLLLADGKQLVTVAVPQPLLEQAVSMINHVLASTFGRRVTRLFFSRAMLGVDLKLARQHAAKLLKTLEVAKLQGSIVVTTGATIKALMLKVVELMEPADKATDDLWLDQLAVATTLRGVLDLFSGGVALLDECDLLLHPLKSEMNFPVHHRQPLQLLEERVDICERLVDGLFPTTGPASETTQIEMELRAAIAAEIAAGKTEKALQSSPHTVLADKDFYTPHLLPALADWLLLSLTHKLEQRDALLAPLYVDTSQAWASETTDRTTEVFRNSAEVTVLTHGASCALDGEPDSFWCSEDESESFRVCSWGVTLDSVVSVGAIDITFREFSPVRQRSTLSAAFVCFPPCDQ
jgi:hypothetical protein